MKIKPTAFPVLPRFADYEGIPQSDVTSLLKGQPGRNQPSLNLPFSLLNGHMSHLEICTVVGMAACFAPTSFLEIGTFDGLIVDNLLRNCPKLEHALTVDLPPKVHRAKGAGTKLPIDSINGGMLNTVKIGERFLQNPRAKIVTQVRKDSAALKSEDLGRKNYDLILVDGCHTYEYCKSDSSFVAEHLAPGGLILWHDYGKIKTLSGVTRYLLELRAEGSFQLHWLVNSETVTSLVAGIRC